jgi:hypothetical protein
MRRRPIFQMSWGYGAHQRKMHRPARRLAAGGASNFLEICIERVQRPRAALFGRVAAHRQFWLGQGALAAPKRLKAGDAGPMPGWNENIFPGQRDGSASNIA